MDRPSLTGPDHEVKKLGEKNLQNESKFWLDAEALRKELKSKGEGSMFSSMRQFIQPGVHDLVLSWYS